MGNVIVGIIMLVAGASGQFSLRGTGSSAALIGLGFVLMIFGAIRMASNSSKKKKNEEFISKLTHEVNEFREEGKSDEEIKSILSSRGLTEQYIDTLLLIIPAVSSTPSGREEVETSSEKPATEQLEVDNELLQKLKTRLSNN